MQVIGIDLGTTNIRISTWDSDQRNVAPTPLTIGETDTLVMPAVVAFRRQPGGAIETLVGEDADAEKEEANVVVIRNVKRYALADDPYVLWHLEQRPDKWQPSWWNENTRCVQVWGQDFPVKDLLSLMLEEAFLRVGLNPGFEWRAGCPVHAGIKYRSELAEVITSLGGNGRGEASRIVEEPILLLTLAHELGKLKTGSYLVYDFGGGSFDCALAQVTETEDGNQMIVYGADGNPVLGGSDIDKIIADALGYGEPDRDLRIAKETVSPSDQEAVLPGGKVLLYQYVEEAVKQGQFTLKTSLNTRATYRDAKAVWKRDDPNAPVGEIVQRNLETGKVKFVWELGWEDMIDDLDRIILCGGPTKSPLFAEALRKRFGDRKIISTSDLIPSEVPDPELTAISVGACYAFNNQYSLLYVNRLPVRITLEDLESGQKVQYEPYEHFSPSSMRSVNDFVSGGSLSEHPDDPHSDSRYELTVTTPDGIIMEQCFVDPYINTRLRGSSLRLIINRLGQVGVEQQSGNTTAKKYEVLKYPPWQTDTQRLAIERLQENIERHQERERQRLHHTLYSNPWGWQEHSG